jgi:hypothetical protein
MKEREHTTLYVDFMALSSMNVIQLSSSRYEATLNSAVLEYVKGIDPLCWKATAHSTLRLRGPRADESRF